ncbi:magnesium transporter CorA family protein [bacterium]|nr:magnesium transporter CorA family protein [bacterium]
MIKYFKRTLQSKNIKEIPNFQIGCWINVVDPTKQEIEYLVKKFKLDKRNLESGLDPNEIPRLDITDSTIYIFINAVFNIPEHILGTYLIIIGKNCIITLSRHQPAFVERIINGEIKFITTQKLKCLIKLLSLINEGFEQTTISIVKEVQRRKRLSIEELKDEELTSLLEQEDILNDFVSSYYYINLLYERIIRKIKFFEQDKEILEDLIVEGTQGFNLCKSSLKTISNIRSYYDILLSNRLNNIITILTIFTILVSFPAAISGIYGMNIPLPLQHHPFAFYYILLLIGFTWIAFVLYLKKRKVI